MHALFCYTSRNGTRTWKTHTLHYTTLEQGFKKNDIAAEGTQVWTFVKKVPFLQKHISVPLNGLPMIIWQN